MENINKLYNISNEIRINFDNKKFFLIEWPIDYKHLLNIIKKNIGNYDDKTIKCYYIKINESDLKINESNYYVNDKEKQNIIEIFVSLKFKEIYNKHFCPIEENKYHISIEPILTEIKTNNIKILQGTKKYILYFKLCNLGLNTLPIITIVPPELNEYNEKLGYDFKINEVLLPEPLKITDMLEPNEIKNYCKLTFKNINKDSKYMIMKIISDNNSFQTCYVPPFFVEIVESLD